MEGATTGARFFMHNWQENYTCEYLYLSICKNTID